MIYVVIVLKLFVMVSLHLPRYPVCSVTMKFKLGKVHKRRDMRERSESRCSRPGTRPVNSEFRHKNRKLRYASKSVSFGKFGQKKLLLDIILAVLVCFYDL